MFSLVKNSIADKLAEVFGNILGFGLAWYCAYRAFGDGWKGVTFMLFLAALGREKKIAKSS